MLTKSLSSLKRVYKMKNVLTVLVFVTPTCVFAQNETEVSNYYIKGGVVASVLDSNELSESAGYKVTVGHNFEETIALELGYADFMATDSDGIKTNRFVAEANWLMPVSDYAKFYAGAGVGFNSDETNPTAQIGIQYQLAKNWYADVGYQGLFGLKQTEDDLYSFNFSVMYHFDQQSEHNNTAQASQIDELQRETIDVLNESALKYEDPKLTMNRSNDRQDCNTKSYTLKKGDYLLKVAAMKDIQLTELLQTNTWLSSRNIDLVYPGERVDYRPRGCTFM